VPKEETIIRTEDVRVRVIELGPEEAGAWHYHTETIDNLFCLSGTISVRLKDPSEERLLFPAERCRVAPGRVHQVLNTSRELASYLLVQGVGKYDFNPVTP